MDSVFSDLSVHAVKIGMLHNVAVIDEVVAGLNLYKLHNIVIDPVMFAQSGDALLKENIVHYLQELFLNMLLCLPLIFRRRKNY